MDNVIFGPSIIEGILYGINVHKVFAYIAYSIMVLKAQFLKMVFGLNETYK